MSVESVGPERRVPGEPGIWLFVLGDMVAFAVMFGVLVATQTEDPALYESSQAQLHIGIGVLNTVVLITSSLLVALGVRAARGSVPERARPLFAGAIACALTFVALKAVEYGDLLAADSGPRANDFFLYFFAFTGLHLLHVLIGIAVLSGVVRIVARPRMTPRDRTMVESGASYWHMVDLLWLVLFALLYLLGA